MKTYLIFPRRNTCPNFAARLCRSLALASLCLGAASAGAFNSTDATDICNSFNNAFYVGNNGTQGTYDIWLYSNVNQAWNIRNANGLSWCDWLSQTPASGNYSWSCSDTVVILQVLPPQ